MVALVAVVVGPLQGDRAQDRVKRLGPVADELGLVAATAADAGATMATVGSQQPFEQAGAQSEHRGADRGLDRLEPTSPTTVQAVCRQRGETAQLGGEVLLEPVEEPPFSVSAGPGSTWSSPGGSTGRASQIASLTATIWWLSCTNRR